MLVRTYRASLLCGGLHCVLPLERSSLYALGKVSAVLVPALGGLILVRKCKYASFVSEPSVNSSAGNWQD